jgi:hypothetical protein
MAPAKPESLWTARAGPISTKSSECPAFRGESLTKSFPTTGSTGFKFKTGESAPAKVTVPEVGSRQIN